MVWQEKNTVSLRQEFVVLAQQDGANISASKPNCSTSRGNASSTRSAALWQIDFKGHFPTLDGPCHALTLPDDHSRFNLVLHAGIRTSTECVQPLLARVFQRYGLPVRINADNGPPWGSPSGAGHSLSELAIWLIRLGVRVSFSAPYHPQTNGKIERFHRSLKDEVLAGRHFVDHAGVQRAFDTWRDVYNCVRPHEALGMSRPAQRYQPSVLSYPSKLRAIEYASTDTVITVGWNGFIRFRGYKLRTSTALHRLPIAIRANPEHEDFYDLYFCHQRFMTFDLQQPTAHT